MEVAGHDGWYPLPEFNADSKTASSGPEQPLEDSIAQGPIIHPIIADGVLAMRWQDRAVHVLPAHEPGVAEEGGIESGTPQLKSVGAQTPPPAVEPAEPAVGSESESELLKLLET